MIPIIQGLGKLDINLIQEDARFARLLPEAQATIEESIRLTDRFTLSYLWVLGVYELVRTLDQRCRGDIQLLGEDLSTAVRELKEDIGRLRIPLAKMEPSKRHRDTDAAIAYPAIHTEFGVSWRLSEQMFVSRRELSDHFLNVLEEIADAQSQDTQ